MVQTVLPAIWLIVIIAGVPNLSETVYTPSLPNIARAFGATASMVEYTLTIYLFAFALGCLFWGKISDRLGRKPCLLAGLLLFMFGCLGCYFSTNITQLLVSRFIQAFGGSVGSVLVQAIVRDAFHGPALGRTYATVSSSLTLFPALGPIVGGFIAQNYGWYNIFLFLFSFTLLITGIAAYCLPETLHHSERKNVSMLQVIQLFLVDRKVLGCAFLVAAANGINFSYYAEGSFYLIDLLGLTPSQYGQTFFCIAFSSMLGGLFARWLHLYVNSKQILGYGIYIVGVASFLLSCIVVMQPWLLLTSSSLIIGTIAAQMCMMFGICMITSTALAMALVDYKWCIGTASSLFGCFYYLWISLCTLGMAVLHNGTLYPMPMYFFGLSVGMFLINRCLLQRNRLVTI